MACVSRSCAWFFRSEKHSGIAGAEGPEADPGRRRSASRSRNVGRHVDQCRLSCGVRPFRKSRTVVCPTPRFRRGVDRHLHARDGWLRNCATAARAMRPARPNHPHLARHGNEQCRGRKTLRSIWRDGPHPKTFLSGRSLPRTGGRFFNASASSTARSSAFLSFSTHQLAEECGRSGVEKNVSFSGSRARVVATVRLKRL